MPHDLTNCECSQFQNFKILEFMGEKKKKTPNLPVQVHQDFEAEIAH